MATTAMVAVSLSRPAIGGLPRGGGAIAPRRPRIRICAQLGGGQDDAKNPGKKKFITREQEPEQYVSLRQCESQLRFSFEEMTEIEGEMAGTGRRREKGRGRTR